MLSLDQLIRQIQRLAEEPVGFLSFQILTHMLQCMISPPRLLRLREEIPDMLYISRHDKGPHPVRQIVGTCLHVRGVRPALNIFFRGRQHAVVAFYRAVSRPEDKQAEGNSQKGCNLIQHPYAKTMFIPLSSVLLILHPNLLRTCWSVLRPVIVINIFKYTTQQKRFLHFHAETFCEATTRFELVIRVLQTHALPLGYVAILK